MSNVLTYLPSHSFLHEFGDVAEVGDWSIILESISVKTRQALITLTNGPGFKLMSLERIRMMDHQGLAFLKQCVI